MAGIPKTSVSLIVDISSNPSSVRWKEMYERYREPLIAYLASRFPSLAADADDLVQETMCALAVKLPSWRYSPDENGAFHCYLTGILKHKAMDAVRSREKEAKARESLAAGPARADGAEEDEWKRSVMEIALKQVLSDDTISMVHRNVFRRVAIGDEDPRDVARDFGLSRGNVDQIKRRMLSRVAVIANKLV